MLSSHGVVYVECASKRQEAEVSDLISSYGIGWCHYAPKLWLLSSRGPWPCSSADLRRFLHALKPRPRNVLVVYCTLEEASVFTAVDELGSWLRSEWGFRTD